MSDELMTNCPECEADLSLPRLEPGETFVCPECLLTLRINSRSGDDVDLELVETQLRDWGQ
jgi:alpha-aminoadipate carrier protein LysW